MRIKTVIKWLTFRCHAAPVCSFFHTCKLFSSVIIFRSLACRTYFVTTLFDLAWCSLQSLTNYTPGKCMTFSTNLENRDISALFLTMWMEKAPALTFSNPFPEWISRNTHCILNCLEKLSINPNPMVETHLGGMHLLILSVQFFQSHDNGCFSQHTFWLVKTRKALVEFLTLKSPVCKNIDLGVSFPGRPAAIPKQVSNVTQISTFNVFILLI